MRRTIQLSLAALVLLATFVSPAAASEFQGIGEVTVIGGNQVSARKRAIRAARRDAVSQAVASILSADKMTELEQGLKRDIYARTSRYVRTYRVLEEEKEARRFRVKVAARLNLSRLRQDLSRLAGPGSGVDPAAAAQALVAVKITFGQSWPAARRAGARAAARKLLQERGLSIAPASEGGAAPANTDRLGLVLDMPGKHRIRGTGWPAVEVSANLTLTPAGSAKNASASAQARAWGASPDGLASALIDAQARALDNALTALRRDPDARAALDRSKPGWLHLHISGVQKPSQVHQLRRLVCDEIAGSGRCVIRGVGGGRLRLAAKSRRAGKAAGEALNGRRLGEVWQLKFQQARSGRIWLTLEPAPVEGPTQPDTGAPQ